MRSCAFSFFFLPSLLLKKKPDICKTAAINPVFGAAPCRGDWCGPISSTQATVGPWWRKISLFALCSEVSFASLSQCASLSIVSVSCLCKCGISQKRRRFVCEFSSPPLLWYLIVSVDRGAFFVALLFASLFLLSKRPRRRAERRFMVGVKEDCERRACRRQSWIEAKWAKEAKKR